MLALATSAFAAGRMTPYSKTTDLGGGKSRTEISVSPVHYYTADGGLAPIVTTVGPVKSAAGAGWAVGNETNLLRTYFAGDRAWVRAAGERAELSFGPVAMRWSDGNSVDLIGNAVGAAPSVTGSKVRYAGVLPGIDAEFDVAPAMLRKSYLLGSLPAMPGFGPGAYLEIGEKLTLGTGVKLTDAAGQPIAGQVALGQPINIKDGSGNMLLDAPVAFDQAMFLKPEERSQVKNRPMPERLQLVVEAQADGSLMFWTRVPYAYLASPDRMYPVVIDPQIIIQPNGTGKDAMLWSGSQANQNWGNWGWQQTWQVGERTDGIIEFDLSVIPPAQTITSAIYSEHVQQSLGAQPAVDLKLNTAAWVENTVTFNNRPGVGPVAATSAGAPQGGNLTWDITAQVSDMYMGVISNFGWSTSTVGAEAYDIPSSDGAQVGWAVDTFPKLVIDHEDEAPPPDPGGGHEEVLAKLDSIEIKLDSDIPDKLAGLAVKLDAIEVKLDTDIPDKLAGLAVKLDAIEIKLDDGGGVADKLDAIEIKLDDELRFTDDAELAVVEAKLDDEARWVDDLELALVEGQISLVEAKLDDETRFTDDAELAVIEAKLDVKDDRIESVEGKLDDETRFTDDSELGQAQQAIVAEIDANEVKIDAIEAKLDGIGEKDELLQVEIEKSLLLHDRISHFYLPAAFGGRLELVREIVVEALVQNQAAGINVGGAAASIAQGDANYAAGDWKGAYDEYQQAYRTIVTGG